MKRGWTYGIEVGLLKSRGAYAFSDYFPKISSYV